MEKTITNKMMSHRPAASAKPRLLGRGVLSASGCALPTSARHYLYHSLSFSHLVISLCVSPYVCDLGARVRNGKISENNHIYAYRITTQVYKSVVAAEYSDGDDADV